MQGWVTHDLGIALSIIILWVSSPLLWTLLLYLFLDDPVLEINSANFLDCYSVFAMLDELNHECVILYPIWLVRTNLVTFFKINKPWVLLWALARKGDSRVSYSCFLKFGNHLHLGLKTLIDHAWHIDLLTVKAWQVFLLGALSLVQSFIPSLEVLFKEQVVHRAICQASLSSRVLPWCDFIWLLLPHFEQVS